MKPPQLIRLCVEGGKAERWPMDVGHGCGVVTVDLNFALKLSRGRELCGEEGKAEKGGRMTNG